MSGHIKCTRMGMIIAVYRHLVDWLRAESIETVTEGDIVVKIMNDGRSAGYLTTAKRGVAFATTWSRWYPAGSAQELGRALVFVRIAPPLRDRYSWK